MKKVVKFLLLTVWLICSYVTMAQDKEETQLYVTTVNLNVRSAPSSNAKLLGTLSKGETVEVYSITKSWANVNYKGSKAFVSAKYIEKVIEMIEPTEKAEVVVEITEHKPVPIIDSSNHKTPLTSKIHIRLFSNISIGLSNFYSFDAYSNPRFGFGLDVGTQIITDFMPNHTFSEASLGFMALGNSKYSFPSFMINVLPFGYRDDLVGIGFNPLKESKWFVVGGFSFQFSGGNIAFYKNGTSYCFPSKPTINLYIKGGVEMKKSMACGIIIMHGINNVASGLPIGIKHSVIQVFGTYYFDQFKTL